ncbi:hypothetical protein EMIHUDRAFT_239338 [Emiliania huxleyi CCMP1516]|uniref:Cation efflux protein transmembrane domain-containing protein n=2 Tax=Emiliania huxleyi TaxID=2903 RepID=A0A0D3JJE1_EMIH1|nr:hypothetical protein EMIHUDRAFT_239338 [Emiliania huxleyi CCMP1516]EOD23626.1 hypothetical protein EMIHUDRAFT_239338 [Emiliania huxleyi CCMP1516]|eukprot:XP_005776055.1 hypothetical protein EMIHUDRAFT_239338 [Emiliania huxleyi CCMP1516]
MMPALGSPSGCGLSSGCDVASETFMQTEQQPSAAGSSAHACEHREAAADGDARAGRAASRAEGGAFALSSTLGGVRRVCDGAVGVGLGADAYEQYNLRKRDLAGLPFVAKYNVYGAPRHTRFYVVFDAIGEEAAAGHINVGSRAVFAAIVGNSGVAGIKFAGWICTGSASLLSESIHSIADLGNQATSSHPRCNEQRPYGYGFEVYVWAMISGVDIASPALQLELPPSLLRTTV